jgi:phosphatidylinositol alpha-1,6-mannosyltransferase
MMRSRSEGRVLALVTNAFGGLGGIAEYNRQFLSALTRCWHEEVIVLPRARARVPGPVPRGVRQLDPVNGRLAYSMAAFRAARKYRQIELIYCGHLYMAPLAAALAKISRAKLWIQVHGVEAWDELSRPYRMGIESASLVTSVSRYTRRRLLEWTSIEPARVKVLPATVDPRFEPGPKSSELMKRHGVENRKVLLTVSRLASSERYKGHDRVIRVLPKLLSTRPDIVYLIVGDGDDRSRLESLAQDLGVAEQVRFAGEVPWNELPHYFRLADLFVMPSTGEGFGIVFLEAMASGIPVIGGNRDGSVDPLCANGFSVAIEPDNEQSLVSAIQALLDKQPSDSIVKNRFKLSFFTDQVCVLVESIDCVSKRPLLGRWSDLTSRFDAHERSCFEESV